MKKHSMIHISLSISNFLGHYVAGLSNLRGPCQQGIGIRTNVGRPKIHGCSLFQVVCFTELQALVSQPEAR